MTVGKKEESRYQDKVLSDRRMLSYIHIISMPKLETKELQIQLSLLWLLFLIFVLKNFIVHIKSAKNKEI